MEGRKKGATPHKNGNSGKHWSETEIKLLKEMKNKGHKCKEISDKLPERSERA